MAVSSLRPMPLTYRPHVERTADQPRDKALHTVQLTAISNVTPNLRLFTLRLLPPFSEFAFKPGQWLDVYVPSPSAPLPGGFTIFSPPSILPEIQLVIQAAPQNPPAAWLFQNESIIQGKQLKVRVGGSFTFPPSDRNVNINELGHILFIGAGVGINPLLSMLQHISERPSNEAISLSFLYSAKPPMPEPYMKGLLKLPTEDLQLFITADGAIPQPHHRRRMTAADVKMVIGKFPEDRTLVYICGPPGFTDEFVDVIEKETKLPRDRVLIEKWW